MTKISKKVVTKNVKTFVGHGSKRRSPTSWRASPARTRWAAIPRQSRTPGGWHIDQALVGGAAPLQLKGLARLHEGAIYEHVDGIQQVSHGQVVGDVGESPTDHRFLRVLVERLAAECPDPAIALGAGFVGSFRQIFIEVTGITPDSVTVALQLAARAAQAFGCSKARRRRG